MLKNPQMQNEIKVGDLVRHRHILQGIDLSVLEIKNASVMVRYANNGVFLTQELFLHEIEVHHLDEREFL